MFNSTVDQILETLSSGVQKLVDLADRKDGEASRHLDRAAEYASKARDATSESARARRVADKVKALLD